MKGLSAQSLKRVRLEKGGGVPLDRAYAIENGETPFDPANPRWLSKSHFVMLMRHEQLAELQADFDEESGTLTLSRNGAAVAGGNLGTEAGRKAIASAVGAIVTSGLRGEPRVVSSPGHSFTDIAAKAVHIVNLASVRALEEQMGTAIDPLRFRPNIVVDGLPAWLELDLIGGRLEAGEVALEIFKRTGRCAATDVNPVTALRDTQIPTALSRTTGHTDFGVYAKVVRGGMLSFGEAITLSGG